MKRTRRNAQSTVAPASETTHDKKKTNPKIYLNIW